MADTGRVPPANGVIVSPFEFPAGFTTARIELLVVVVTNAVDVICDVPVARPTTVYARSALLSVSTNWPDSNTGTWKVTLYTPMAARSNVLGPVRAISDDVLGPS